MISKHITCRPQNDNYGRLAGYIAAVGQREEKTLLSWCAGCWTEDDYQLAIQEVETVQKMNVRTAKEKTYHLLVSFRPEDEDKLTPEIFKEIEGEFAQVLGLAEYQRHAGVHRNTDNLHLHVAYNLIHPERMTRHEPFRDFWLRDQLCRRLEQKYGLTVDPGRKRGQPEAETHAEAHSYEIHTGQESLFSYAQEHKAALMADLSQSQNWSDCQLIFRKYGLKLKPKGNGLIIQTLDGRWAIKASDLDRSLSQANLEKRYGIFREAERNFIQPQPPEVSYTAAPVQINPDRDNLYEEYQKSLKQRRAELANIHQQGQSLYTFHQTTWQKRYEEIRKIPLLKLHRRKLMTDFKTKKQADLEALRQVTRGKSAVIRKKYPFTTWNQFLQEQARQGREIALAILRSRKKEMQPEQKADLGDARYSQLNPKTLKVVEMMTAIWRKEADNSYPPPELKYTIDAKGTVIFACPKGGSVRDSGSAIHFSPRNEKAKNLAQKLAQVKWGQLVELTGNTLKQKPAIVLSVVPSRPHDISR
ncbi:hypothetical protein FACS189460_0530 [Deltaproteobacteria bacterium]|nr:hypothetical protein FACS189460_0530 [Deltaproteobacteria bacterium]